MVKFKVGLLSSALANSVARIAAEVGNGKC